MVGLTGKISNFTLSRVLQMAFMRLLSDTNSPYNVMQNCENLNSNITYKTEKYENVKTIFEANSMKMENSMYKSPRARTQRYAQ